MSSPSGTSCGPCIVNFHWKNVVSGKHTPWFDVQHMFHSVGISPNMFYIFLNARANRLSPTSASYSRILPPPRAFHCYAKQRTRGEKNRNVSPVRRRRQQANAAGGVNTLITTSAIMSRVVLPYHLPVRVCAAAVSATSRGRRFSRVFLPLQQSPSLERAFAVWSTTEPDACARRVLLAHHRTPRIAA